MRDQPCISCSMALRTIATSVTARTLATRLLVAGMLLSSVILAVTQASGPAPMTVGSQIAGTFGDATGHSAQSHLVYAANSRVWWLFTLTSAADSEGGSNHVVKSFRSSGPDLATATWIAGADSPAVPAGSPNQFMGGGRSLGIAYLDNSPLDVIHADISMAFDGQDGRTGHIRAVVTATSIAWESWDLFDEPAATWTMPRGNTIGVSSGKFIHTGGPILQQEVDANARKSANADTGTKWTSGFSVPAVIDGSMTNQANSLAFAPLANNVMLAVYDNGQGIEPRQTNLRYKKSNADGSWRGIVVGSQTGGDGDVFPTAATIDQNDWALVSVGANQILVFRRKANGTGIDAASYNAVTNTFSPMSPAPPSVGSGQSVKAGAGLFGATDGTSVWVCVINTDVANSILYTKFDGATWTPWSVVPGTEIGLQNRNYISGSAKVGNNQIGVIWTEGASTYDVVTTLLMASEVAKPVTPTITWPAPARIPFGTPLGAAQLNASADAPGTLVYTPPAGTVLGGGPAQILSVMFTPDDATRFTTATASVTIDVVNVVPNAVGIAQQSAAAAIVAAGLTVGSVSTASSVTVPAGIVLSQNPAGGLEVSARSPVDLVVSSGPPPAPPSGTGAIGINFAGATEMPMDAVDAAGVIEQRNWNNAGGAQSSLALPLVDESGRPTGAAVTWSSARVWNLPIADVAGNARLMSGYLDTTSTSSTTVTVTGLARRAYDVYVYADGDNRVYGRSADYTISGDGITTTTLNLADAANTNFGTTFTRAENSNGNYVKFTIEATGFTLTASPALPLSGTRRAPVNAIQIVPAATEVPQPAIGIKFVGSSPAIMAASESAGVVPQANWNNAAGAASSAPFYLVDNAGTATTANVTWAAHGAWMTPIADQPGNARLMKGYLDTSSTSVTTVMVAGLPQGSYDVYVYTDGDNRVYTRTAAYQLTGPGLAQTTVNLTDVASTNFSGTFTEAAGTSGNYVKFSITGTAFTLTATPGTSTNATLRAPVNAIQIVRVPNK